MTRTILSELATDALRSEVGRFDNDFGGEFLKAVLPVIEMTESFCEMFLVMIV